MIYQCFRLLQMKPHQNKVQGRSVIFFSNRYIPLQGLSHTFFFPLVKFYCYKHLSICSGRENIGMTKYRIHKIKESYTLLEDVINVCSECKTQHPVLKNKPEARSVNIPTLARQLNLQTSVKVHCNQIVKKKFKDPIV